MAKGDTPPPVPVVQLLEDRYGPGYFHPAGSIISTYDQATVDDLIKRNIAVIYTPPQQ